MKEPVSYYQIGQRAEELRLRITVIENEAAITGEYDSFTGYANTVTASNSFTWKWIMKVVNMLPAIRIEYDYIQKQGW